MPSIHVGWAAVVSFGIVAAGSSRWRGVFLLHLVLTILVVSASGHHWWLDGIVAIALLGLSLMIDTVARRTLPRGPIARSLPRGAPLPVRASTGPQAAPTASAVGVDGFSAFISSTLGVADPKETP